MLLRRITEHVKNQNWIAVIIDFTIVVFGILLAFQVTEWNQDRKDRVLEREYLQRAIQDLDGDAKSLETAIQLAQSRAARVNSVLILQNDAKTAVENHCAYLLGVFSGHNATLAPSLNQTYNEMVTSGNLSLLRSNSVKNQLGIYYNNYRSWSDSMQAISRRLQPLAFLTRRHMPVALGQAITEEGARLNLSTRQAVDVSKFRLCSSYNDEFLTFYTAINNDPEFYGLLQGAHAVHSVIKRSIAELLESNRSLKALIEGELGG